MRLCKILMLCLGGAAVLLSAGRAPVAAGGKDKPAAQAELIVVDANGKEHKLKTWKFPAGTRRLSWLAPAPAEDNDKDKDKKPEKGKKTKTAQKAPAVGPEAIEFSAGT